MIPRYSGRSLAEELGVKPGSLFICGAPDGYAKLLQPLPNGVSLARRASQNIDIAQVFVTRAADLATRLKRLRATLNPEAAVWVSWPTKASKLATDVTDNTIRAIALPSGWVDIKVGAVPRCGRD